MVEALKADFRSESGVTIDRLSKSFEVDHQNIQALRDLSLEIEAGEFVTLVGPSGCGKSTLLRLLAGLDRPDGGGILVDGEPIREPSVARGIVFQDHRLLPWMSVTENVALSLHAGGGSKFVKAERVKELVDLVGLSKFAQAKPHQLSGGMAQRAAIARALAPRPRLLLLDEPFGALDSLTRSRLQNELLRFWEHEKVTVVMVTHDVEEAVFLSNRVVVMEPRPGRIKRIVSIDFEYPRKRTDGRFVDIRQAIIDILEDVS